MPLDFNRVRQRLKDFDFPKLFVEELGWDRHREQLQVVIDGATFTLSAIAQKRGMVAFVCDGASNGGLPDYAKRRKIEHQTARSAHEHLIIYTDPGKTIQIWQWVKRATGRPTACREHTLHRAHTGEALIQKLQHLAFSLEEEVSLTLVDVTSRVRKGLDVERMTRRFYDKFKAEHEAFLKFIKGIPDDKEHSWYASVMLNRLMFIYFIQKKGFLNGDADYLKNKLAQSRRERKDAFYREFLSALFFEGFANKQAERSAAVSKLLGQVPYLNGGIFQRHQIEESHRKAIKIDDSAFERLFAFFDAYQWHLDDRPLRRDDEINPDVLGYIFEKYINQKQMGAYYTKEDITEYISKNTVLPFLFDRTREKCKIAFEGEQSIWKLLRADPDRYVYSAVRRGVIDDEGKVIAESTLPDFGQGGMRDPKARMFDKRYNLGEAIVPDRDGNSKSRSDNLALPTETWREYVQRRQRCLELRAKLAAGEVRDVNDLITLNLNIRQFAQDVIENCEGPELLRAFWRAIENVTVLDPTCGSGAFLFAALNILQPLYDACLDRMQAFVTDLERSGEKHRPEKFSDFREVLDRVAKHPNHDYFVLKSIIVNNLFGVDIMEEATEISKLRLFLKLVSQVETVDKIEPLPDIDFNIRAGNTLVGYATYDEVKSAVVGTQQGKLDVFDAMPAIETKGADLQQAFDAFRQRQVEGDGSVPTEHKREVHRRLDELKRELNRYLARDYGKDESKKTAYAEWLRTHKPFHWFIEFHGIMQHGGFDVIIGNPPYVSVAKVRNNYTVKHHATAACTDIYAWVLERVAGLVRNSGRTGMIVPLSLGFSADFESCRGVIFTRYDESWFSSFGRIPSALFSSEVRVRNFIHIGHACTGSKRLALPQHTTRLHRWFEAARPVLFNTLEYAPFAPWLWRGRIPKVGSQSIATAFEQLQALSSSVLARRLSTRPTQFVLHFKKTAYNWLNFCKSLPPCYDLAGREIPHTKFGQVYFTDAATRDLAFLLLNGKIMFAYWCIVGDDFDVTRWMFEEFPFNIDVVDELKPKITALATELEILMCRNGSFKLNAGKRVGNYNLAKCREVTDASDKMIIRALNQGLDFADLDHFYFQMVKTAFADDDPQ